MVLENQRKFNLKTIFHKHIFTTVSPISYINRVVRMVHRPKVFQSLWNFNKHPSFSFSRPDSKMEVKMPHDIQRMQWQIYNNSCIHINSLLLFVTAWSLLEYGKSQYCTNVFGFVYLWIQLWILPTYFIVASVWGDLFLFVSEKCLRLTYFLTKTHYCLTVSFLNITVHSVLFSISRPSPENLMSHTLVSVYTTVLLESYSYCSAYKNPGVDIVP